MLKFMQVQKRQKKEGDPPITRAEVWIETHTRKDGSVPSGVTTHMVSSSFYT